MVFYSLFRIFATKSGDDAHARPIEHRFVGSRLKLKIDMMTKLRQWLLSPVLIIVGAMMLAACSDTKDAPPSEQPDKVHGIPAEARTLVRVMNEANYSPDEFLTRLGSPSMAEMMKTIFLPVGIQIDQIANSLAKVKLSVHLPRLDSLFAAEVGTEDDGTRRWRFESYTFTYQSVTADGQSIEMSGRVTFPNNVVDGVGHEVNTLSLHSHQELPYPDWAPSESMMFMPMRAMYNSAVIEPDFQNWGINHPKFYDDSGSPKALNRQLVDCTIAALEVMQQHGVTLAPDGHTTNWGGSKCAAVPIIFAKYYQTEAPQWFRDAIRLGSTFTGEGEYDLSEVLPYFFQNPKLYLNSLSFMSYLVGLSADQVGGYEVKDLFAPWVNDSIYHAGDKDYTILDALALKIINIDDPCLPEITTLDQVLAPDMLTPDGRFDASSPKAQALFHCLIEENDVYGWEPTQPIYIAHCPYDDVIPYSYSRQFYLRLSNQETNPAVHWLDIPATASVVTAAYADGTNTLHLIVSFFMHLYMSCVEEPADMAKMYVEVMSDK